LSSSAAVDADVDSNRVSFATAPLNDDVSNAEAVSYHALLSADGMVTLEMEAPWREEQFIGADNKRRKALESMLQDHHGLNVSATSQQQQHQPTFCNSSIARNKTLVRVDHESLHAANAPTQPQAYKEACDAMNSTGLYLYAEHPHEKGSWECVSFSLDLYLDRFAALWFSFGTYRIG